MNPGKRTNSEESGPVTKTRESRRHHFVTDRRCHFSRYLSPLQHNVPETIEHLFEVNDVVLYDLQVDSDEMQHLAVAVKTNGDLLLAMN